LLFYFITFPPKWFALAVAAASAELRALLLYKMLKILPFLCRFGGKQDHLLISGCGVPAP